MHSIVLYECENLIGLTRINCLDLARTVVNWIVSDPRLDHRIVCENVDGTLVLSWIDLVKILSDLNWLGVYWMRKRLVLSWMYWMWLALTSSIRYWMCRYIRIDLTRILYGIRKPRSDLHWLGVYYVHGGCIDLGIALRIGCLRDARFRMLECENLSLIGYSMHSRICFADICC